MSQQQQQRAWLTLPTNLLQLPWFLRPSKLGARYSLLLGCVLGFSISLSLTGFALYLRDAWKASLRRAAERRVIELRSDDVVDGVEGLIGNTPLVRIKSLSDATGVEILGKCEFLNPFGSVKDRVSLRIIKEAEAAELLHPHTGSCVFEGTSGSTGISIADIVLPEDVAREKVQMLKVLGAEVEKVKPVGIVDKRHYVNLARQRAAEFGNETLVSDTANSTPSPSRPPSPSGPRPSLFVTSQSQPRPARSSAFKPFRDPPRGLFADQFENLSNMAAHETGTAVEIWHQTSGLVDAFVSGAGTGGTIAGVGKYLKEKNANVKIVLSDPQGSGLYHKIHDGVMYSETESEGKRRRHQVDTVVEGIGLNRLTRNFSKALPLIDDAIRVTDAEAVAMSRHIAREDGLFLGSSSAVNLVASVRLARKIGAGKRIVTILCDSGTRHHSRFWNDEYLQEQGIPISADIGDILAG